MQTKETTLVMPDDYEGRVVSTLIEYRVPSQRAVLYIHGYIDYFFQNHLAERFADNGFSFYALDLRKYGRSMLEGQHPNYCRRIEEYYADIDRALEIISDADNTDITLIGHSTGGLITSLYCAYGDKRELVNRLILNSPFFEFNTGWFKRHVAIPLSGVISIFAPYAYKRNELSEQYCSSIHISAQGEWEFDLRYKPKEGIPLYFAWLNAVYRGQRLLKKGLGLKIPVLVMHSGASFNPRGWNEVCHKSDIVLNVEDIKRYAGKLGKYVTVTPIEGGMHDLVLSAKEIRERALDTMVNFAK